MMPFKMYMLLLTSLFCSRSLLVLVLNIKSNNTFIDPGALFSRDLIPYFVSNYPSPRIKAPEDPRVLVKIPAWNYVKLDFPLAIPPVVAKREISWFHKRITGEK